MLLIKTSYIKISSNRVSSKDYWAILTLTYLNRAHSFLCILAGEVAEPLLVEEMVQASYQNAGFALSYLARAEG